MRTSTLMLLALLLVGCGTDETTAELPAAPSAGPLGCADVIEVGVTAGGDGTFTFDATVRSADTGWDKYADLWEVVAPDGTVLGARLLAHPHVDEQPFTRRQSGIVVPDDIDRVTVRARDSVEGFCGQETEAEVPR